MRIPSLLTVTLILAGTSPAADRAVAIKNARIVTVTGQALEKGTVIFSGGRITAVGSTVSVPAGAQIIDGTGKTVYPGLVDGLTSVGLTEIASISGSVDTSEVGDINPHAKAWVAVHPHSELIPVARANGLTTVLTAPIGGLISGQSALIRLSGTTPETLLVKTPVAMHMNYPTGRPTITPGPPEPSAPKTFEEREREKRQTQEKELGRLRNLLEEAKAYGAALEAARAGKIPIPQVDLVMEALAPVARGELPVICRVEYEEDIRGAVKFAEERGLKLIIAGGLEAWRCAELLKSKNVAVLLTLDRLPRRESDAYDAAYTNAAALHSAGVLFAIVSDDAALARNLPYEAAMARSFGLPAEAAIRAITLSPAEILGVADRLGSITVGKSANLFVATGDIMDHRTQVTHVFIDGVSTSLETRHTRLYKEFKDRP